LLHVGAHCGGQVDATRAEATQLLQRAIAEKVEEAIERIFRLLGLRYPANDIYSAFLGTRSPDSRRRARALEFLDNLLQRQDVRFVFPFVEPASPLASLVRAKEQFKVPFDAGMGPIGILLHGADNWLRTCALFAVNLDFLRRHEAQVLKLCASTDPRVNETARWLYARRPKPLRVVEKGASAHGS
jgi:AAA family ATP:ADP antiporter